MSVETSAAHGRAERKKRVPSHKRDEADQEKRRERALEAEAPKDGIAPEARLRPPAEERCAAELKALAKLDADTGAWRPVNWRLSPLSVVDFILGGDVSRKGAPTLRIAPKYVGERAVIERIVATLAIDRPVLLIGEPGTGKSYVSELAAAAISGDSRLLVQCSAGTDEHHLRYTWHFARCLQEGFSRAALAPSPVMRAMRRGAIARLEEFTRLPSEVQDALLSIISEKELPVPELEIVEPAQRGFNLIATANDRDQGVNDLSAALQRRFNHVRLPSPASMEAEAAIVARQTDADMKRLGLPIRPERLAHPRGVIVRVFRDLRGWGADAGAPSVQGQPGRGGVSAPLSAADAAEALTGLAGESALFGDGETPPEALARRLVSVLTPDPAKDRPAVLAYAQHRLAQEAGEPLSPYEKAALEALAALLQEAS